MTYEEQRSHEERKKNWLEGMWKKGRMKARKEEKKERMRRMRKRERREGKEKRKENRRIKKD